MPEFSNTVPNPARIKLPSLRNLDLLSKGNYFEKSLTYPDTCLRTPTWRQNLMNWCKETSYDEYIQISNIVSSSNLTATPVTILSPPQQNGTIKNAFANFSPMRGNHHLPPPRQFNSPFQLTTFNHLNFSPDVSLVSSIDRNYGNGYHGMSNYSISSREDFQPPTTANKSLGVLASIASNILVDTNSPPPPTSTLKPVDQFYELSNYSNSQSFYPTSLQHQSSSSSNAQIKKNHKTPPASPRINFANKNQILFTPTLSNKMIQKQKKDNGHKKTNSFKARQYKKILNNRNVLNGNSLNSNIVVRSENDNLLTTENLERLKEMKKTQLSKNKSLLNTPTESYIQEPLTTDAPYLVNTPSPPMSPSKKATELSTKINNYENPTSTQLKVQSLTKESPPSFLINMSSAVKNDSNSSSIQSSPKYKKSSRSNSSNSQNSHKTYKFHQCLSCKTQESPCWRPSWSNSKKQQLCNSCGLRYKKSKIRCLNNSCLKIPSLSEAHIMKNGKEMKCLYCSSEVEVGGQKQ
ncbi:hypothetical protein HANVADRAFT_54177 [Hanseniaspora valbyensis NRRL Y-1626]|uniref:GATA-type domain-containing protein n=1 Tax=Hanseniaspora valbyensis NRRL Y-1626 TaxID=766949 RepID=A0A1B7T8E8_9ASCO|nr:hypothetical protein HANVADRAFT_54177 [Hanseniaspora valbyensis NRRL Y-1626]